MNHLGTTITPFCMLAFALMASAQAVADYKVIPLPQTITTEQGAPFILSATTTISCSSSDEALQRDARFLQQYIHEATGIHLSITDKKQPSATILLSLDKKASNSSEGYKLTVDQQRIIITGSAAGIFYGIQTLRKSLPQADVSMVELPAVSIIDAPRFSYRGLHLDCARHFFSVDEVKTYTDMMALHNMNTFHWHLTDDQGWRIEIKRYPRLTEVGAWRSGTVIGNNSAIDDSIRYGGYYTQAQIRDIVSYAADRYITIIPEVDMPGHTLATLASYPELGCTGGPYEVGHRWGVGWDVLCVGNPKTLEFAENVLEEVIDLFPSHIINIGGDETPTKRWDNCPRCKALGVESVQGYFTHQMEQFVSAHGRRAIGWDEMLEHGVDSTTMILSWRGEKPGIKAAEQGNDVVMSPLTYCYLDYYQDKDTRYEPSVTGMWPISVEKVYSYEPIADSLSVDVASHIIGVQGNVWTEHIVNFQVVQYQTLPRIDALCSVQWEQRGRKDFDAFRQRVTRMATLYDRYGWTYAEHLWPERIANIDRWHF